ncbi:MAG TPA: polymer-forming cytoskeletal protein [Myxococcota bacterium]|nr:polymer-forming cytoskeletal protein [Myxococcota bacterium]
MREDDALTPQIGAGTSFDGLLSFEGTLRVEGELAGAVLAETGALVVAARGRVRARVEVAELVLAGVLVGDVVAHRRVELLPGAELEGNVTSPRIAIADGGRIAGRCTMGPIASFAPAKSP